MAGIYIHIPFCKQACNYCNFHFATSPKLKNDFVAALLKEMDFQKEYLQGEPVETIYFGGGTPSLLTAGELISIMEKLKMVFSIATHAEITFEANPDDINVLKLKEWRETGINRLSIGVQSFYDEDLVWMNRAHHAVQAFDAVKAAQQEGFDNITIDLIYGTPGLSDDRWKKNVEQAVAFNIPHLSCYALTVEPKTPLYKMIREKKTAGINHDRQAEQFFMLMEWTSAAGYEHYEISNFAKPGKRSLHNSSYWQGKKYLGLGPSAHSYNGSSRQWNVANNAIYIHSIERNILLPEKEELTGVQKLNEYIMTSLRTIEGCDMLYISEHFGLQASEKVRAASQPYLKAGQMEYDEDKFILTKEGKLLADGIAAVLFF